MSDVVIYNVELFRGERGTFYMLWVREVSPTRYARFRLEVPTVHGNLLRVLDDTIWTAYAKRHIEYATQVETDGSKEYRGPRGPSDKGIGTEDSREEADAADRPTRRKATRKSVDAIRTKGNSAT